MAEVVVWFDRVPAPFKLQVTPSELSSFDTTAVSVTESVPSTFDADADTATLKGPEPLELLELPPQPDRPNAATKESPTRTRPFRNIRHPREQIFVSIHTPIWPRLSSTPLSAE